MRNLTFIAGLVLALSGCSKKDKVAQADTDSDGWKSKMCACSDNACTEKVLEEYNQSRQPSAETKSGKKGFKQLVGDANAEVTTWTVEQAIATVGKDDVAFIDLREPEEVARDGAIPGAEHAPRGMLEFFADPESPVHKPVFASGKTLVLYCGTSGRSALAAKTLKEMGLDNVSHIGGGFKAWVASNGPVQK
jgi:rhodanese-related sulfurtransferase